MEPSEAKPERGDDGLDGNGQDWQILAEYSLQLGGGADELARQGSAVTEAIALALKLPPAELELLKNAVLQAALNARGHRPSDAIGPVAGEDRQQAGLPMRLRILTPGSGRVSGPGKTPMPPSESEDRAVQAWGYFLVEKMIAAGTQVKPVIDLFLYPEGSV